MIQTDYLLDHGGIVVCCRLDSCHIGEGGLVGGAGQDAEEVFEILEAGWTAHKKYAGQLHLRKPKAASRNPQSCTCWTAKDSFPC